MASANNSHTTTCTQTVTIHILYATKPRPDAVLHLGASLVIHHSRESSWSGINVVFHYIKISELSGHD